MTDKRNFNQSQRRELFLKADGKCQICSCDISLDNFHADHKIPFCEGGKTELNKRKSILKDLANGKIDLIIGTHALFQKKINFKNLGFAIIDEQHKFGVKQRSDLAQKG